MIAILYIHYHAFELYVYFNQNSTLACLFLILRFYQDIGGCDIQKQEIREAVELPLTHHELYKQIGIDPPRGVLLYGPPGTGKTMLAKAVANHTTAAFIRVVGSEFVQKYLGEVCVHIVCLNKLVYVP
jgi:AAA+ superfamily predicted ATPase